MKNEVGREVRILSLAFLFIFLGYNGTQQYVTAFFDDANLAKAGFVSLVLVYGFFTLANPLAAVFISHYGAKKSMALGSIFYATFIFALLAKSAPLAYAASAALGLAAGLLWTGMNSYLIRASSKTEYGANSGLFSTLVAVGSGLGIILSGFLIAKYGFAASFILFGAFPIIGFALIFSLHDLRGKPKTNHFALIKKFISSPTGLKLGLIGFAFAFAYGLLIGIIPIEIKNSLGIIYVGLIGSLPYVVPIVLSYAFGKYTDTIGRKKAIMYSYAMATAGLMLLYMHKNGVLLVLGVLLIALTSALIAPSMRAFLGDISNERNVEFAIALFLTMQSIGTMSALLISTAMQPKVIYLISLAVIAASFLIILPTFRLPAKEIRARLAAEMG